MKRTKKHPKIIVAILITVFATILIPIMSLVIIDHLYPSLFENYNRLDFFVTSAGVIASCAIAIALFTAEKWSYNRQKAVDIAKAQDELSRIVENGLTAIMRYREFKELMETSDLKSAKVKKYLKLIGSRPRLLRITDNYYDYVDQISEMITNEQRHELYKLLSAINEANQVNDDYSCIELVNDFINCYFMDFYIEHIDSVAYPQDVWQVIKPEIITLYNAIKNTNRISVSNNRKSLYGKQLCNITEKSGKWEITVFDNNGKTLCQIESDEIANNTNNGSFDDVKKKREDIDRLPKEVAEKTYCRTAFFSRRMILLFAFVASIFIGYMVFSLVGGIEWIQKQREEDKLLQSIATGIILTLTASYVILNLVGLFGIKNKQDLYNSCCFSFCSAPAYLILINACLTMFETSTANIFYATSVLIYIAVAGIITELAINIFSKRNEYGD